MVTVAVVTNPITHLQERPPQTLAADVFTMCNPTLAAQAQTDAQAYLQAALGQTVPSNNPVFFHMLGCPGSGKTTMAAEIINAIPNIIWNDHDRVMLALQAYHDHIQKHGEADAFTTWEIPARAHSYQIIDQILTAKRNMLQDHGGSDPNHPGLLAYAKSQGYKIVMIHCNTSEDTALERVKQRNANPQTKRHTPLNYVPERLQKINQLLPQYQALANQFFTLNEQENPKTLAQTIAKTISTSL